MQKSRLSLKMAVDIEAAFELVLMEAGAILEIRQAVPKAMALVGDTGERLPQNLFTSKVVRRAYAHAVAAYKRSIEAVAARFPAPAADTAVVLDTAQAEKSVGGFVIDRTYGLAKSVGPRRTNIVLNQTERLQLTLRFNQLMTAQPTRDKFWAAHMAQDVLELSRRRDSERRHNVLKCVFTDASPLELVLAHSRSRFYADGTVAMPAHRDTPDTPAIRPAVVMAAPVLAAPEIAPVSQLVGPIPASSAQAGAIINILSGRASRGYDNQLFESLRRMEAALTDLEPLLSMVEKVNTRLLRLRRDHQALTETVEVLVARQEAAEKPPKVVSIKSR